MVGRITTGWTAMTSYTRLRVRNADGVAFVTIDNAPVNVLDVALMGELRHLLLRARESAATKVIVFDSANPDFFIAHVDMTLIDQPNAFDGLAKDAPPGLNVFQAFAELVRRQPQVTIVKLAGVARGGGAEFVAAADMAFAAIGKAGLAQCEALMGIVPGGGGTQYALHRLGRDLRALRGRRAAVQPLPREVDRTVRLGPN
jgi:enoyl-CoA hydratase/carnithine racemase